MIWFVMKETFLAHNLSKEINNWLCFMKRLNSQTPILQRVKFITKTNKNNLTDSDQIWQTKEINS